MDPDETTTETETTATEQSAQDAPAEGETDSSLSLEDALKALARVRGEAAGWRTKYRDAETKLSQAKTPEDIAAATAEMQKQIESKDRELLIERARLPKEVADSIPADVKGDSLKSLVETLAKYAVPASDGDLSGGLNPSGGSSAAATPRDMVKRARSGSSFR